MKFTVQLKALFLILGLLITSSAYTSGGYDEDRGLYGQHSPDFPLNNFLNGQLGVINPQYRLSYLIIAYRYLSNNPLSKKEQRDILAALASYFHYASYPQNFKVDADKSNEELAAIKNPDFFKNDQMAYHWWQKTISLPLDERIATIINHYPSSIKSFTKYQLASVRLEAIVKALKAAHVPQEKISTILQTWLQAQDHLFTQQHNGDEVRQLIQTIPRTHLSLLKLDGDYMMAVSYFNSENKTELLKSYDLFTQLGNNDHYPWHEWAEYLSYRALTRAACQDFDPQRPLLQRTQQLTTALTGMQKLALYAKDYAVKKAAQDYKNIIKGRVDRKGALMDLVNQMQQKITKNNFSNMIFYTEDVMGFDNSHALSLNTINENNSEILFWVANYLSKDAEKAFATAYSHWLKAPKNLAWLLVALNNIQQANPSQQKILLKAAEEVTAKQPGFFSIRSSLIQALFLVQGNSPASIHKRHHLIDDTLAQLHDGEDFSTHMHFNKMGIPLADNIDNLLSYGFFIPSSAILAIYPPDTPTTHPYFSPLELSQALNYLPLSVLVKVIASKQLPLIPKQELYASVWARAMIMGRYSVADHIAKKTAQLNPALNKIILSSLQAKNPEQRLKVLIRALLYFPELSPIINLKNTWTPEFDFTTVYYGITPRKIKHYNSRTYWCGHGDINRIIYSYRPPSQFFPTPWLSLLTSEQQKELDTEQALLKNLPDGAEWLADQTNKLAKKYPQDKENAELLALAINVTRVLVCYNQCSDASKHAYITLKRLYPNSEAAKRTKYYY